MMSKMANSNALIDDLNKIVERRKEMVLALKTTELVEMLTGQDDDEKKYRLPYSSDPKPIEEPWQF